MQCDRVGKYSARKVKMAKPNGYIIYEGPSVYDGNNIVVIVTGITKKSANGKTGDMLQTWILHQDIAPHLAIKTGEDFTVCGKCPLRPLKYKKHKLKKKCYVQTWRAPLVVWKKYKRGEYDYIAPEQFRELLRELGRGLRLGSYGDPACVPFEVWQSIGVGSGEFNHTSYTHGYLLPDFDTRNLDVSMVSLDPTMPELPAWLDGRSFRVIAAPNQVRPDEILCPASKEEGYKTTCARCGLCAGLNRRAKNIAIVMHG